MANEVYSEKVSVNMNVATLASIDLLVDSGHFSNRSDFINQAVREALVQRQSTLDDIVTRNRVCGGDRWFVGISGLTRREVQELLAAGETMTLRGYGVLVIGDDVPEEELFAAVESIEVRGKVKAPAAVKEHYGLK